MQSLSYHIRPSTEKLVESLSARINGARVSQRDIPGETASATIFEGLLVPTTASASILASVDVDVRVLDKEVRVRGTTLGEGRASRIRWKCRINSMLSSDLRPSSIQIEVDDDAVDGCSSDTGLNDGMAAP